MAEEFPYGNDLKNPVGWAGLRTTKSKEWLVAYHSGFSFFIGYHTFLFFGKESLSAGVVTLKGAGLQAGYSGSKILNGTPRAKNIPSPGDAVGRMEKAKTLHDGVANREKIKGLSSAEGIYNEIFSNSETLTAKIPFSLADLDWKRGAVSGVSADAIIGSAGFYVFECWKEKGLAYFIDQTAKNISNEATLLGAQIGIMEGIYGIEKDFSLFSEKHNDDKKQFPFQSYAVDPYFQKMESASFKNKGLFEQNNLFAVTQNEQWDYLNKTYPDDPKLRLDTMNEYEQQHRAAMASGKFSDSPFWIHMSQENRDKYWKFGQQEY